MPSHRHLAFVFLFPSSVCAAEMEPIAVPPEGMEPAAPPTVGVGNEGAGEIPPLRDPELPGRGPGDDDKIEHHFVESDDVDLTEAARLIRDLGDDDFDTRQAAMEPLEQMGVSENGDSVKRLLVLAMHTHDLEVRWRARQILQDIQWWLGGNIGSPGMNYILYVTVKKADGTTRQFPSWELEFPYYLKAGDKVEKSGDYTTWTIVKQEWEVVRNPGGDFQEP